MINWLQKQNITTTLLPSAGFEPAIAAIERFQTYALDRTATGFDSLYVTVTKINSTTCLMLCQVKKVQKSRYRPRVAQRVPGS